MDLEGSAAGGWCSAQCAAAGGDAIIARVKHARPSLVQSGKPGTGGTSGLHRTAQELTALHREVRIRATETSPGLRGDAQAAPQSPSKEGPRPGVKRAISARSNTK